DMHRRPGRALVVTEDATRPGVTGIRARVEIERVLEVLVRLAEVDAGDVEDATPLPRVRRRVAPAGVLERDAARVERLPEVVRHVDGVAPGAGAVAGADCGPRELHRLVTQAGNVPAREGHVDDVGVHHVEVVRAVEGDLTLVTEVHRVGLLGRHVVEVRAVTRGPQERGGPHAGGGL